VDTCAAVPKTEATIIAANSQLHRTENSQDQAPEQPAAALQPSTSSDNATPDMIIWVGYVKSWRHMGSATISCISGCHCQPSVVDGLHADGNTQQHLAKLFATQAQECLVEVKVRMECFVQEMWCMQKLLIVTFSCLSQTTVFRP
jgi:hypothetical protein